MRVHEVPPQADELAEHEDATAARGGDEVEFLGSRAKSTPLKAATLRAMTAPLTGAARREFSSAGVRAHADGTTLNTLYMRHADAVLGFPSFRQFLLVHWPEALSDAYGRMRLARYCTEDQSRAGMTKCLLGIQLVTALELASFGALVAAKSPIELALSSGEVVTFAVASVTQLEDALRCLKPAAAPADETAGEALARTRRQIRDLVGAKPEYEELHPTASLQEGEIEVRVRARGRARFALAGKFYEALAKKR